MSSDIQTEKLIFRKTPPSLHPYIKLARLDRPIGTWLLLFPGWWSLALAGKATGGLHTAGFSYIALFALGALLMRSAGCIVNDLWDSKLDAQVERTRTRPLASGELTRGQALRFLLLLLALSFSILLCFNKMTIILGFLSLLLVGIYPYMKRVTWWPQLFLGFTFNWGALMGWSAVTGGILAFAPLLLYAGGIFWTLAYDTIYAHQDKEDDAMLGIKSTALLFGQDSRKFVAGCFTAAIACFVAAKYLCAPTLTTHIVLIFVICQVIWQMRQWSMDDPASCLAVFRSNQLFGWLVLAMMVF